MGVSAGGVKMRFLRAPIKTAAVVAVAWIVTTGADVNAQQRGTTGGTRGSTGTGGTTGTGTGIGTGSPTTGRSSTMGGQSGILGGRNGAGTQGGSLTGEGVGQPEFRPFGSTLDLNSAGIGGLGAADAFAAQQRGGQQMGLGGQQALGLGTAQQFGGLGGRSFGGPAGGRGALTPGAGQATTRSRAEQLRPRHRVSFPYSPVSNTQVSTSLRVHLRPLQGRIRDAQFSLAEDGTLTLRGTAASADARELAEAVARLEPGVRRIDNQIVVPQAPNPSPQPPGEP